MVDDLRAMTGRFPRAGCVEAVYLRPERNVAAVRVESAMALAGRGLAGDRRASKPPSGPGGGRRQVTLMQAEHLPLIGAWTGVAVDAAGLRRNLVVSGVNLIAPHSPFTDRPLRVRIGADVLLAITGSCAPCSKRERLLGPGGYNAMRGHGGTTARVLQGGVIRIGDAVTVEPGEASDTPPDERRLPT